MKPKTIKKVLNKTIGKWLESITDESVRKIAGDNCIVTGGSIASMLLKESVNDYDIYFKTKDAVIAIAKYYANEHGIEVIDGKDLSDKDNKYTGRYSHENGDVEGFADQWSVFVANMDPTRVKLWIPGMGYYNVNGLENIEDEEGHLNQSAENEKLNEEKIPFSAVYFTENAITLSDQIQLVLRFYGDVETIHENYDFVHATNSYDYKEDSLNLRPEALITLLSKELQYIGSKYPVTSIIRTKKFIRRGWTVSAGTYLKILLQVSELDLYDPVVLQEQLTGVDIAYFSTLIQMMKNRGSDEKITYAFVADLIEKVFN